MQPQVEESRTIPHERTKNFHSDGIRAYSCSRVTGPLRTYTIMLKMKRMLFKIPNEISAQNEEETEELQVNPSRSNNASGDCLRISLCGVIIDCQ